MRRLRFSCLCALTALASTTAHAQTPAPYPVKPVRVVVGLAPGGGTDIQTRLIAQKLTEALGRPLVVENRTGAGGTVAYAFIAKSAPDGYTLLGVASGYSITPAVFGQLPYDPIADFAPISLAIEAPFLLLTHPAVPAADARGLIALAKARPGALDFGSAGHGSSTHMAMELFKSMAGVKLTHVPYNGTGPALSDLVAGQIPVMFGNILSCLPYVKAGRLRALGVTSARRSPVVPRVPTIAETGVPGYVDTTWHGWLAPAGTPRTIVLRLSSEIAKAVKSTDIVEKIATDGGEAIGSTPEQFSRLLIDEIARWRKVARAADVRVE